MKPAPEAVDAKRLPELSRDVMKRAPFPMLATVGTDGHPRVRPVSPVKVDGFVVWVASMKSSNKTAELESNELVELCYLDERHDQVRISGPAELVEEAQAKQSIWDENPLLRAFLGSVDNPEFMLYRIEPKRIRFMREWALEYFEVGVRAS